MVIRRTGARRLWGLAAGATLAAAITTAGRASACGGFWCSVTAPVEQTGEQILFVQNGDGTTTCVVDIAYQGPSEHFAWVLPVEGVPQIGVSSGIAFDRLAQRTAPQWVMNRHVEGQCDAPQYPSGVLGAGGAASFDATNTGGANPSIDVLAQGSVGPYDYAVIKPNPALTSPAQVALDWLESEGYDVGGVSDAVLGPYLADGLNLIAFRLTKGTMVGSIRPVVLTYNGDQPSIPIRPTAVAAQDDMGVLVYIVSGAQAVPQNYRSLVIDEAAVNWFSPTSSYPQVVSLAADEAGGQGFVTEMAEPSSVLSDTVFSNSEASTWSSLRTQTFADPLDLVWAANNSYRGWDGWRDAIAAAVTLPPGASLDDFGRNPNAYRGMQGFSVDAQVFLDQLEKNVVGPVRDTQKLIDSRPYVTRLFTTMSADEMTIDPVFTFNSDLSPISNVHTADLYIQCRAGIQEYQAPWRLELPQGGTIRGEQQDGRWVMAGRLPANRKIVQLSETGSGQVIQDNTQTILSELVKAGGDMMPPSQNVAQPNSGTAPAMSATGTTPPAGTVPPDGTPPPPAGVPIGGYDTPPAPIAKPSSGQDSGCALARTASPVSPQALAGALAALVLLASRRRR